MARDGRSGKIPEEECGQVRREGRGQAKKKTTTNQHRAIHHCVEESWWHFRQHSLKPLSCVDVLTGHSPQNTHCFALFVVVCGGLVLLCCACCPPPLLPSWSLSAATPTSLWLSFVLVWTLTLHHGHEAVPPRQQARLCREDPHPACRDWHRE